MISAATAALGLLTLTACITLLGLTQESKGSEYPPSPFEDAILEFERLDRIDPPPAGAIVVTGSSHIRRWTTIKRDFAPLTIIHRGYGGSTYNDALLYADRIMIPYKPRAIVVYSGNNDLHQGVDPETVRDTCRRFIEKVRADLPEVHIYVVSIPPAIRGWEGRDAGMWLLQSEANRLIRKYCASADLTWIDISTPMFDADGNPKKDIFDTDDLHLNEKGYRIWRDTILPVVLKKELAADKKSKGIH